MRILITGGCGFIGANLVFQLKSHGDHEIVILDNETRGKREYVDGSGARVHIGDIRDKDMVGRLMDGIDAVVHLAADSRVMDSIEDPQFNFDVNVVGTFNILTAMKKAGVRRIVNASTGGAILGEVEPPVNEDMVPNPLSPYGASKLFAEGYLSAFAGSYGFNAVSLRFSNVYGPRSYHKGSVVAEFYRRILNGEKLVVYGDGEQTRDYVYIDDLCSGIIQGIMQNVSGSYQLGTGQGVTINQLIDLMREVTGSSYSIDVQYESIRSGEIKHTYCDISKARKSLEYDPQTSLKQGLRQTWDWFRSTHAAL